MTVHEVVHALVFNPALFDFFRDPFGEEETILKVEDRKENRRA